MAGRQPAPLLLAVLVGLLLAVASCGGEPPEVRGPVLDRGLGPEPESLDPHLSRTVQAHHVLRDLFEGLLSYSPEGKLSGGVAEAWEVSDDGLLYTFRLRDGARWSNGAPVTADDFVTSFRRLVDPATAAFYGEALAAITNSAAIIDGALPPESLGIEARDPRTLVITLERPTPYFLSLLTQPSTFPINAGSLAEHGPEFARPGRLVSNGAYTLESWTLGSVIDIVRNEYYWDDANTAIDVVRHHVTPEPSAELYRYRAGELHLTSTVPSEAFDSLLAERPDELRVAPTLSVYFYGMNLNYPVLGEKPDLREALSMAIDRETLVAKVVGRGERPAYSFVPPGVDNYTPPELPFATMSREDRHERAQRLYAQAGYGPDNPLVIELRYNTSETHQRIALAVQEMWREVLGFEATLINEEFRVLVANMRAMKITEIFRLSWNGDYNDAHSFLNLFESDNPSNMFGYSNEEFDSLMQRAASQTDLSRRRLYMEEAERVLLAEHAVIPLYFLVSKHLVSPEVCGWRDNVLDYHYSRHLSFDDCHSR